MRNGKPVVTNFTKCVIVAFWRHNVWPFRGIWVSKQVHSCTFLLSIRSPIFTGPKVYCAWPGIKHNKGQHTKPSGDVPRERYQQHCQYRLRGLRYIARGLASSIIKRNMPISNRWRHILNARNYRKKIFRWWAFPYLGDERFRNQINKSVLPYSGLNSVTNTDEYGGCTGLFLVSWKLVQLATELLFSRLQHNNGYYCCIYFYRQVNLWFL